MLRLWVVTRIIYECTPQSWIHWPGLWCFYVHKGMTYFAKGFVIWCLDRSNSFYIGTRSVNWSWKLSIERWHIKSFTVRKFWIQFFHLGGSCAPVAGAGCKLAIRRWFYFSLRSFCYLRPFSPLYFYLSYGKQNCNWTLYEAWTGRRPTVSHLNFLLYSLYFS